MWFWKLFVVSMDRSVSRVAASSKSILFPVCPGSNPIDAIISFSSFLLYNIFICTLEPCLDNSFSHLYIVSLKCDTSKHKTHVWDATECIGPIGYGLFNIQHPKWLGIDYELYSYNCIKKKKKNKKKKNKTKKQGMVMGFELATSMAVYKRCIHYATYIFLWLVCEHTILNIIKYTCSKNTELKKTLLLVNIIVYISPRCKHEYGVNRNSRF